MRAFIFAIAAIGYLGCAVAVGKYLKWRRHG